MGKTLSTVAARIVVFLATAASFFVVLFSKGRVEVGGGTNANWASLEYFMATNAIASCYSLLVLFLPSGSRLWRLVAAADSIICLLITTAVAATAAVLDLMRNGNADVGWRSYCPLDPAYCNHIIGATAACSFAVLIQIALVLYTFHVLLNPLLVGDYPDCRSAR
ncbi:hypothetical protein NMG60_11003000 [Bertholletia excelsa]